MIKYKVTEEIQKPVINNRYMNVGIHENVELTRIEYAKTEKSEYLAFYFVNERNEQLSHTEWMIRFKQKPEDMEEGLLKFYTTLINEQIARINRIATTFISEDDFRKVEGDTFEAFSNATIAALGNSYKGKKIRIKVVYDKRNYTSLPSYLNYQWIESMDIPTEKSAIEILSKDKMVRDLPAKMEGANTVINIIEKKSNTTNGSALEKDTEDLPF